MADYRKTLNLPKTDLPMKANLPAREPEMMQRWEEENLYQQVRRGRRGAPKFVLHDGPPYANGVIHMGHALNKTLKDVTNKYRTMKGFDTPFVPGWDTHGLPIEREALKKTKVDRSQLDALEIRKICRELAEHYITVMTEEFKRMGVRADWDHPYITLDPGYEAEEIRVFGAMVQKGLIYKDFKTVNWCPVCETALAEAEIEYAEKTSTSVYVSFRVLQDRGPLKKDDDVLIWTTTAWTLPANRAVALHPDRTYVRIETPDGVKVLGAAAWERLKDVLHLEGEVKGRFAGREAEGAELAHPVSDTARVPVVLAEYVTEDAGTGAVHIAPGHGEEDFEVGKAYGLEVVVPIDGRGVFTAKGRPFQGVHYSRVYPWMQDYLKAKGRLVAEEEVTHPYPHCWRCQSPIVFRATEQWFGSIAKIREALLNAIGAVAWVPEWGKARMTLMTEDRADWCISRQRVWGVPIPVFYCEGCHSPIVTGETIGHVSEIVGREGSDAWFAKDARELLPADFTCPECGGGTFTKERDTLDVWFDSGSSHAAVLKKHSELAWPADLYLEGTDQFRGYFNSSLTTGVATEGRAPYKRVLIHGFVVDAKGRKMSKSRGNAISPKELLDQYGADILRLWVISSDYTADIHLSKGIMGQIAEGYRKLRNTLKFMLGNLNDFELSLRVPDEELPDLERFVLGRFRELVRRVDGAYGSYDYHVVYHQLLSFATTLLSSFYLDVRKDVLYCDGAGDKGRRAAQTAIHAMADGLLRMLSPVLTFTAEEVYAHLPKAADAPPTAQLLAFPNASEHPWDEQLDREWERLLQVRLTIMKALEEARAKKEIGASLEAHVALRAAGDDLALLERHLSDLPALLIVSGVSLESGESGLEVRVTPAAGEKCARCWMVKEDVGGDPSFPDLCGRCAKVMASFDLA